MIIENNENDYESSHNRVNNKSEIAHTTSTIEQMVIDPKTWTKKASGK